MKNIIALSLLISFVSISCSHDKPKNVAPADYAETEQKLIQNKEVDSTKSAENSTTTANGYKVPNDSAKSAKQK